MRFPYTKLFPNTQPRPYLTVFLGRGYYTSNHMIALVDSGADYPIFPIETARDYLKLDLSKAEHWNFSGTTGTLQEARLMRTWMTVLDSNGDTFHEIETTCAFSDTFKMAGGVLLGQVGFFSSFKTTFCQPEQYFEIEPWSAILGSS